MPQTAPTQDACVDLLRMTDDQFAAFAAALPEGTPRDRLRPRAARLGYTEPGAIVAAIRPTENHDVTRYKVRPLNLSQSGAAFLHGASVFPGTPCSIQLLDRSGEARTVPGRVVRCRRVEGRVHEVGVRFDEGIELAAFIDVETA